MLKARILRGGWERIRAPVGVGGTVGARRWGASFTSMGDLLKGEVGFPRMVFGIPQTKVVCTIGPVSESLDMLGTMVRGGMTCMRINCSHATFEEQANRINRLRQVETTGHVPVPVLLDIKGPSIRTGFLQGPLVGKNKVTIGQGTTLVIRTDVEYDEYRGSETEISVSYTNLHAELSVGDTILIDDGLIELVVEEVKEGSITTTVIEGGLLGEKKGLNLPGVATGVEFMTEKDKKDMVHAVGELGVDFVAASFVRGPDVIRAFREFLDTKCGPHGKEVGIVAKIENVQGLCNYEDILEEVQGIMVARGDLGVEIPTEKLFLMQKLMIEKANERGRFVINCTQMLDSMITNTRPTRAEALDVANAVLDGADATMLSGESAGGKYPEKSVQTMRSIIHEADKAFMHQTVPTPAAGRRSVEGPRSDDAKRAISYAIKNSLPAIVVVPESNAKFDAACDLAHEIGGARPWAPQGGSIAVILVSEDDMGTAAGKSEHRRPGTTFRQLALRRSCWPVSLGSAVREATASNAPADEELRKRARAEAAARLIRKAGLIDVHEHLDLAVCAVTPGGEPHTVETP